MDIFSINLQIVLILAVGFAYASILGYLTYRARLSPILGYLIAGYLIGPYSPGFEADLEISEQLAEIGVILMMFGVGLHFKLQDLINVKYIAIPGAIGQTAIATIAGAALIYYEMGWTIEAGIVLGLAIGVASTVVLIRVLTDNALLHTPQGHISMGWLIVEDLITVFALLLIPTLAISKETGLISLTALAGTITLIVIKFIFLLLIMFTLGRRIVVYVLAKITQTQSHELFTLTLLALTFVIATGSSVIFGVSIALGAFIAGMVIGQTDVHRKAAHTTMPLRDAFAVIFFLSVGMLFNPMAIFRNYLLFFGILAIILILKPLTAFLIALLLRQSFKTAVIVALALAQIGEFSFILCEEATRLKIMPDLGYDIIVACAIVSIAINPILFKLLKFQTHSQKSGGI